MTLSRLQKIIAQAGMASRRGAEDIIQAGRVRVNGQVVTALGTKADPGIDRIEVDGKVLSSEAPITLLMNKPRGVVCTLSDPEGRPTVADYVKGFKERLYPVGRLDFATSGALIMTNDGDLSYALTHPKHKVEKVYLLKVAGQVDEVILEKWRMGVDIGDVVTHPAEVFKVEEDENFTWIQVTLREGRNRQIRRMGEATGLEVKKLKRVSFAGLTIEGLRIGEHRILKESELKKIRKQYHIPSPSPKNDRTQKRGRPRGSQASGEGETAAQSKDIVFGRRQRKGDENFTTHEFKVPKRRRKYPANTSVSSSLEKRTKK